MTIARFEFISRTNAFSFANRAVKAMAIMLGDNGKFWVVTLANMDRLLRAGYEVAL